MIGEIRALLARNLPGYEVRSLTAFGEGLDNVAYEVNGELVVRAGKEDDPAVRGRSIRREADLLAVVAESSTLPAPKPVFVDVEAGALAYPKLTGLPLLERPVAEPARLAPTLGEFLDCLHWVPLEKVEVLVGRDLYPPSAWREDAERDYRRSAEHLPAADRRLVEDFLGRPPPEAQRAGAFCHNDLGAEHVLVDAEANAGTGCVTGVVDWADAAIADPARDFAPIYRDLGPAVFDPALAHYEHRFDAAAREWAIFYARCKLTEDIAYGLDTPGAGRYAGAGLARLTRTFA